MGWGGVERHLGMASQQQQQIKLGSLTYVSIMSFMDDKNIIDKTKFSRLLLFAIL